MTVIPIGRFFAPAPAEILEVDTAENESADPVTKCGRCRLNFVRHPSIAVGDSPKWWLCPPCRARLLGNVAKTNSRWK